MRTSTPGKLAFQKKNSGITLIELLVALAIVGVIVALAGSALRSALNTELKANSRELASLIRYVRSKAITEHKYLRVALDFGESTYWVEVSADPFVISPEGGEKKGSNEEIAQGEEPQKSFEEIEDDLLLKRRALGNSVFFKDVAVGYLPQKKSEGLIYLYFFPDGYATEAMINLRDEEDEEHFSVEVMSLSGTVTIAGEQRDLEEKKSE
ncbi:MAG: prepilin-type N-terminal cleavage/methylation domain-containing protein [Deltaproteobacteria bacterium]|nr:prepilin-type N-terminal cleavage/methylation domain-containing protein [Deltaproteobacteria bacterium]